MGIAREIKRKLLIENMKLNGMRTRCRKCGAKMAVKSGYGWVCPACGYMSDIQRKAAEYGDQHKTETDVR